MLNDWYLGSGSCEACPQHFNTPVDLNLWAIWLLREAGKLTEPAGSSDAAVKAVCRLHGFNRQ